MTENSGLSVLDQQIWRIPCVVYTTAGNFSYSYCAFSLDGSNEILRKDDKKNSQKNEFSLIVLSLDLFQFQ